MKNTRIANFMRKTKDSGPVGRDSTPLRYQKGQIDETRMNKFQRVYDPGQGWTRKWTF
jgi:hypothetical protein